ncbi:hypothetical protein RvY_17232 [Ramazzottius varieornatus]|uniref:Uncharacterized protein n=1 Tax=Ramazzottius varieornatus TaxID=947166 RepID=A0A1D1W7G4_RAMVA|nr:hypothetical protein RvY_17232 [Ramazzottius varieornatus]
MAANGLRGRNYGKRLLLPWLVYGKRGGHHMPSLPSIPLKCFRQIMQATRRSISDKGGGRQAEMPLNSTGNGPE